MNNDELKEIIKSITYLRDEIKDFDKPHRLSFGPSLKGYVDTAYDKLKRIEHGYDPNLHEPYLRAKNKLDKLQDIDEAKLDSAFKKYKGELVTTLARLIKDLQR